MIEASIATYPPRKATLLDFAATIAPQVDVLNIALNEYTEIPKELAALSNVNPVIPDHDTKDAGKFLFKPRGTYVLLCDDDLVYPKDYVAQSVERFEGLENPKSIGGYHTSTYRLPRPWRGWSEIKRLMALRKQNIPAYRHIDIFYQACAQHKIVDQVASGVCILRACDFPSYDYMKDSQKFVDVRLAKWCFEQNIMPVALPRVHNWITPIRYDETIYDDFTKSHPNHVSNEIWSYAFKIKGRGKTPSLKA